MVSILKVSFPAHLQVLAVALVLSVSVPSNL